MGTLQAALSGGLLGGLFAMMAVGLSVSWGVLRMINLAHFGMVLLGAYLTFELASQWRTDPILTLVVTVPALALFGAAVQWVYERAELAEFASLLVSFGVLIIIIQVVHNRWTADPRRLDPDLNPYGTGSWFLFGDRIALPWSTLLAFGCGLVLIGGAWMVLRTTFLGRAVRAAASDRQMAAAFGINHRRLGMLVAAASGATAAVAGMLWAVARPLAPDAPFEWIGIVFAVVILGGIGQVLGTLAAGVLVGVLYGVAGVVWSNTASLLVVFLVIVLALLLRPRGLFVARAA
jgi:branched-chain amino acid transport system permease protein